MDNEINKTFIEKDKNDEIDGYITNPFSTKDIKITNVIIPLYSIIDMLADDDIDLNPDFQRHSNLWSNINMSRLIESILLKLPLPIFYFDVSNPDKWIVYDLWKTDKPHFQDNMKDLKEKDIFLKKSKF